MDACSSWRSCIASRTALGLGVACLLLLLLLAACLAGALFGCTAALSPAFTSAAARRALVKRAAMPLALRWRQRVANSATLEAPCSLLKSVRRFERAAEPGDAGGVGREGGSGEDVAGGGGGVEVVAFLASVVSTVVLLVVDFLVFLLLVDFGVLGFFVLCFFFLVPSLLLALCCLVLVFTFFLFFVFFLLI